MLEVSSGNGVNVAQYCEKICPVVHRINSVSNEY